MLTPQAASAGIQAVHPSGLSTAPAMGRFFKRALIVAIIWAVGWTTRKTLINWNVLESLQQRGQPYILCVWHNTVLYFISVLAPLKLGVMISRSRDGEDITWISERFGWLTVRGSPAEGGMRALREMMRALEQGQSVVITSDGPKGPVYKVKPGIIALARHKRMPILPVAYSAPRRWEFGSWDRMRLPKPFSRTVVWVGDPIDVTGDDIETGLRRVEGALVRLTRQAETFTGADRHYPDPALEAQALQSAG
jgi:lysophospholipid acyltransferase (LPLAT)-like uncharacterized protein